MKNIKFWAMTMAVTLGFGMISCGDDNDESPIKQVPPSEVPSPTITDASNNEVRVQSAGGVTFNYDENGKLTSFGSGDNYAEFSGNSFTYTSSDEEDGSTTTVNIALNQQNIISAVSYKYYEKEEDGGVESEEGAFSFTYNGSNQLTSVKANGVYSETETDEVDNGNFSLSVDLTWSNGNLVSAKSVDTESGSGYEIKDGQRENFVYSETETTDYTITYGSEQNGAKQFPYVIVDEVLYFGDIAIFNALGLLGVGPVNLPTGLSYTETEVDVENGKSDTRENNYSYNYKFDMNNNGTIATEYIQYQNSTSWSTAFSYSYGTTRAIAEQARKLCFSIHKALAKKHNK